MAAPGARAGDDAPRLPCGAPPGAPAPVYADPGQPPNVQVWRGKTAQEWQPPACSGLNASRPADILVAVAGSFRHDGEIDELMTRIGAVSTRSSVRYWSTTDRAWKPLVTEAFALSGPDPALRRADFGAASYVKGQSLHYAQSDNRSSGKTVYRERLMAVDRERLAVSSENLTPVKMAMLTLFDTGDLQKVYFLERRAPGVWNYYSLTRTRMASPLMPVGSEASYVNRSVAFYRFVAGIATDLEPPAAK